MRVSKAEKEYLFSVAKTAIMGYFDGVRYYPDDSPQKFQAKGGVFVTLTLNGELRGCIGYPLPEAPIARAVAENAVNAAFNDPRFPPLSRQEFNNLEIEITLLTVPKKIEFSNPEGLLKKIKIGRDGLMLRLGPYVGLFLPQVPVEQGWDKEQYLSHLCIKAGLEPDAWLKKQVSLESFQGAILREKDEHQAVEKRK